MIETLALYAVLLLMLYFAIPAMLQMLFCTIFTLATFRIFSVHIPLLFGGAAAWILLAFLWQQIDGSMMPIAAFAMGLIFHFLHGWLQKEHLNPAAKLSMTAETMAIILLVIGIFVANDGEVRWI